MVEDVATRRPRTDTADRIRKAALRLFASRGYAAVPMRMIAQELGLQAGALYNHFPTKQALLRDLLVSHLTALIAEWEGLGVDQNDPQKALDAFTRFHIRYHIGRVDEVFIANMELRSLEPEGFREVEALRQRYEAILTTILQEGARRGVFDVADPRIATMAIVAMLTGVTTWFRSGGRLSAGEIEEIYTRMAAASVAAKGRA